MLTILLFKSLTQYNTLGSQTVINISYLPIYTYISTDINVLYTYI